MQGNGTVVVGNYTFNWGDILGKGVTGNVYKGIRNNDYYPVAVKAINLNENQNQITKALLDTEIKALKLIKTHPNLIKTFDILQENNFCFIITELYSGGTLKQLLQKEKNLLPEAALQIFHKIVSGYCAISDVSIIHRDLKPANIMLKQNSLEPVIIDFGFAQIIQTKTVMKAFNVGSPAYMAPQAFSKTLYSEKSDIWSLGVILYEMLTGETLDEGIETKAYFSMLSDRFIEQKINSFTSVSKEILNQVLRADPLERISIHKIKYILDKDAIMKMNNPTKHVHSSMEFGGMMSSIKNEPIPIHKSISFDEWSKKQIKVASHSRNVDMYSSVNHSRIGPSPSNISLTAYKTNNYPKQKAQSRYKDVLLSPSNHHQSFKSIQIIKPIPKTHQFELINPIHHKTASLNFSTIPHAQLSFNSLQHNQRQIQPVKNQFFNSMVIQKVSTEPYPFRSKETNVVNIISEKPYFSKPEEMIRPMNEMSIKPFGKENSHQAPLFLKQRLTEQKKIIKQYSNPNKFSFKKMLEQRGSVLGEQYVGYDNRGRVQNVNMAQYMDERVTQLNLTKNIYSSVNPTNPRVIRSYMNHQPPQIDNRIHPQPVVMRRLF